MKRHDPTTKPDFLNPERVRRGEQFWFEDFAGWNVVAECHAGGGEPPDVVAVWAYGQGDEWKMLPWDAMPKWFWDGIQEAVDNAFFHGYEEYDYLCDKADREYGEDAA